jgi:NosR/NirI family transcriptional regulator, nitrous oxide reductase regulator
LRAGAALLVVLLLAVSAVAVERFPPPDFETGYSMPGTMVPAPRAWVWEMVDVALLVLALSLATWLVLRRRSRTGVAWLGVACLIYFGFYREGCVCPVGATQNVALALFDSSYALPIGVLAFFVLPLGFALFFGRSFCSGVCPLGAIQDVVLLRPVRLKDWLDRALRILAYVYLGLAVYFAATGAAFVICRYDPFVGFFRLSAEFDMLVLGGSLLIIGVFVGRPYCRFLCPYGVLLDLASRLSRRRVTITPKACIQCRLCEDSCPYGAITEPSPRRDSKRRSLAGRRLIALFLLLPVLVGAGAFLVSRAGPAMSRVHPTVALSVLVAEERAFADRDVSDETRAFRKTGEPIADLEARAREREDAFVRGGWWLGAWIGLVIGVMLIGSAGLPVRSDYEADRGRCLSCARCYEYCPVEHDRREGTP